MPRCYARDMGQPIKCRNASSRCASQSFRRLLAAMLAVPLMVLSGCSDTAEPTTEPDMVRAEGVTMRTVELGDAASLDDVVSATRVIGRAALEGGVPAGNVVVSPASLATAFAMLAEGARGDSLAALDVALGARDEERRDAFAALHRSLNLHDGEPADATADELPERPIVHLASRAVLDEGFEVNAEYLRALADGFGTGAQVTDLGSKAGKKVLDEWVKYHTGGLIEESAIEPSGDLRLVLQDAVLLAARWQRPFLAMNTTERSFTLADGDVVDVPMMSSAEDEFAYAELADGWVAVRLPYQDAAYADLLLPPPGGDPVDATPELLVQAVIQLDSAVPVMLDLAVPTVDIKAESPLDLIQSGLFERLGLDSLLCEGGSPDLSGIAGGPGDLCIDQAAQQAVLRIDEEGTVAAAVTELGVTESAAPIPEKTVHFDRPFLFTINHDESGWPLFYAAIRDPRAAN